MKYVNFLSNVLKVHKLTLKLFNDFYFRILTSLTKHISIFIVSVFLSQNNSQTLPRKTSWLVFHNT